MEPMTDAELREAAANVTMELHRRMHDERHTPALCDCYICQAWRLMHQVEEQLDTLAP